MLLHSIKVTFQGIIKRRKKTNTLPTSVVPFETSSDTKVETLYHIECWEEKEAQYMN